MDEFVLKNIEIGYKSRKGNKVLSHDINATLKSGTLTCFLGLNGAGKSTLLRTMAGFQSALKGEMFLNGELISNYSDTLLSKKIGVVLTDKIAEMSLTATELVSMGRMPYTGFFGTLSLYDKKIVKEAIEKVGMSKFANSQLQNLSDGECQKLMIAKVLAQQTDVILLDEPIAFLDFAAKIDILMLLRRLAHDENKIILLSIHDIELALQVADNLWLLDEKGCLSEGLPKQMAESGRLDMFFNNANVEFDIQNLTYKIGIDSSQLN